MIHYLKLIQIILNLTEIEALSKCIRNLISPEIPSLVKHQTNIIQASDEHQTNSILQSFRSKLKISCILDKSNVFLRNVELYLTILSIYEYAIQYLYDITIFYNN